MEFKPKWIVVHHSATERASVAAIRQAHLDRGWDDIGYHWLIDPNGFLHTGRDEGIPGAHVLGFNQESFGVCCLGSFDERVLSETTFAALVRLLCLLCQKHDIPVAQIIGHTEAPGASSTRCPGFNIIKRLPELRECVAKQLEQYSQQAVSRAVFLTEVNFRDEILVASGLIFNTGFEQWQLDPSTPEEKWRVGARLRRNDQVIWEGRNEFDTMPVPPNDYRPFYFSIELKEALTDDVSLEIDLLREGCFWTGEIGQERVQIFPAKLGQYLGKIFTYSGNLLINSIAQPGRKHILIKGFIKNTSTFDWGSEATLKLHGEIHGRDQSVLSNNQSTLTCLPLKSGARGGFSMLFTLPSEEPKNLHLEIRLINEVDNRLVKKVGLKLCFPLVALAQEAVPYGCAISLDYSAVLHNFALSFSGTVRNTGLLAWDNSAGDSARRFRIGARLRTQSADKVILWEGRAEIAPALVVSGQETQFSMEGALVGLSPGRYEIELEMLKENEFWFSDYGAVPTVIPVEIKEQSAQPQHHKQTPRLLLKSCSGTRVFVITPTLPLFDREAGGKRLMSLLEILISLECRVTVGYESAGVEDPKPYLERLKDGNIEFSPAPFKFIAQNASSPFDICIVIRYESVTRVGGAVRQTWPQCLLIADSVDVQWVRSERMVAADEIGDLTQDIKAQKVEEVAAYCAADIVWAVTEEDREAIIRELPGAEVMIVPYLSDAPERANLPVNTNTVLFVGSFNHPPNASAALWAHQICDEYRKRSGQPLKLLIIGPNPPEHILELHDGLQTIVTGFVPDLTPYYHSSKLLLAPIKFGAGVKGKICDAICAGLPVATTPIGNEGLGLKHSQEAFIASETSGFVQILEEIFIQKKINFSELTKRAQNRIEFIAGKPAGREVIKASLACRPVVICIVTYNQMELLKRCLDAVFERTSYPNYHVAVLSNGCTDGSPELLQEYQKLNPERMSIFLRPENQFFVEPNNFLIRQFKDSDIVLMNNDVQVLNDGWLLHLYRAAYSSHQIGAAGGLLLDAKGMISEAGAVVLADGHGINLGRGLDSNASEFQRPRYVGYVSGCLLYMKRTAITKCGELDKDFQPMYYEDVAWQYRLHQNGLRTIYTPLCMAIHLEGSTTAGLGMKRFQEINRQKFLAKFDQSDISALARI